MDLTVVTRMTENMDSQRDNGICCPTAWSKRPLLNSTDLLVTCELVHYSMCNRTSVDSS